MELVGILLELRYIIPDDTLARDIANLIADVIGLGSMNLKGGNGAQILESISVLTDRLSSVSKSTDAIIDHMRANNGELEKSHPGVLTQIATGVVKVNSLALKVYQVAQTRYGQMAITAARPYVQAMFNTIRSIVTPASQAEEIVGVSADEVSGSVQEFAQSMRVAASVEEGLGEELADMTVEPLQLGFEEVTYVLSSTASSAVSSAAGAITGEVAGSVAGEVAGEAAGSVAADAVGSAVADVAGGAVAEGVGTSLAATLAVSGLSTIVGAVFSAVTLPDMIGNILIAASRANQDPDLRDYDEAEQQTALAYYTNINDQIAASDAVGIGTTMEDPTNDQDFWLGRKLYMRNMYIEQGKQMYARVDNFWSTFKTLALNGSTYQTKPWHDQIMNEWEGNDAQVNDWLRNYMTTELAAGRTGDMFHKPADPQHPTNQDLDNFFIDNRASVYEAAANFMKEKYLSTAQQQQLDMMQGQLREINQMVQDEYDYSHRDAPVRELDRRTDVVDFDPNMALYAANCCEYLYTPLAIVYTEQQTPMVKIINGFEIVHVIRSIALLGYDRGLKRVVVAFRGTTDFFDMVQDLKIRLVQHTFGGYYPIQVAVHEGFSQYYESVAPELMTLMQSIFDHETVESVVVTGHSLGGALASMFAFELYNTIMFKFRQIPLLVYTFGCPRVGNDLWRNLFDRSITNCFRCANRLDIITQVPLHSMHYRHVGRCVLMDISTYAVRYGSVQPEAPTAYRITPHALKRYMSRLGTYGASEDKVMNRGVPKFGADLNRLLPEYSSGVANTADMPHMQAVVVRDIVISRAGAPTGISPRPSGSTASPPVAMF